MTEGKDKLPDFNLGALPGEEQWSEQENDEQLFVKLEVEGEAFTGQFLRLVGKGNDGVKFPGLLFAEYPSGTLRILPHNWSIAEKIAEKERVAADYWSTVIVRLVLREIVNKKDGTTVKLFAYQYMPKPEKFAPRWTAEFPATPATVGA